MGKYGWEGRRGLPAAYIEDPALREEVERQALIKTLHFIYYVQNELQENWSVADDEYCISNNSQFCIYIT